MSIIGGVIAGVLGFTSLMGFVFYFLVMEITSVGLAAKAGFSVHSYFDSWNRIILDGFLGGLMQLLFRVLGCQPQGAAVHNFVIQLALSMVSNYKKLNSYRDSIIFMWYLCLGSAQKIKENALKGYWYSSTCPMAIVNHLCSGGISLALENY
ncbi:ER membrane protein complex subunit 6 [Heracleum sosnowskyi]|uniref:ER membrane protein complex subunit 6 n=1 Tax=Heracleum sosnowskyi TaxID=360622 RepID=A0AAD8MMC3_9APIA|nr:ER membrane protein complex subunit 6 [Heracleum sosnowskyi]